MSFDLKQRYDKNRLLTGQALILAAGESSRFWPLNQKHKSLFKIMGQPLILKLIEGLKKSGIKEAIIVQSSKRDIEEELKNYSLGLRVRYVIQKKPLGTGDAILAAAKFIKNQFFVLNAERVDCQDYLKLILKKAKNEKTKAILLSAATKTPWLFGNLKVKGDKVLDIIEKPKKGKNFSNLKNIGVYFLPKEFLDYLKKEPAHPYSFIKALSRYAKEKELKMVKIEKKPFFLKYPWDLLNINEYLLKKIKKRIKEKIEKNCNFIGSVVIEEKAVVKSGTYIEGPVHIGKNCRIGPNCYIRPFTSIGENCHIGTGVEIKNSIIGAHSNVPHLNYVGDSVIGENCNLAAGTMTANVRFDKTIIKSMVKGELVETGRQKFGCILGQNSQTGVNSLIMPGVLIGSNCQIGPNSLVRENIEDNKIFYTKFQETIKKCNLKFLKRKT